MDSLVSDHGNLHIKHSYKDKFSHTSYVNAKMDGLKMLKHGFQNNPLPRLQKKDDNFMENYYLNERDIRTKNLLKKMEEEERKKNIRRQSRGKLYDQYQANKPRRVDTG